MNRPKKRLQRSPFLDHDGTVAKSWGQLTLELTKLAPAISGTAASTKAAVDVAKDLTKSESGDIVVEEDLTNILVG